MDLKVLLAHNFYRSHTIGGEDIVFERELAALSSKVTVIPFTAYTDKIRYPSFFWQIFGFGHYTRTLKNMLQTHKPDVVHFHNTHPLFSEKVFKIAKESGAKVVVTVHNYRWWCIGGSFFEKAPCMRCASGSTIIPGIVRRCYRKSFIQSMVAGILKKVRFWGKYLHFVDTFICLSPHQFSMIKKMQIPENKICQIPHFIQIEPYESTHREGLLFVGRLEPGKGYKEALDLLKNNPDLNLYVVGDGPLKNLPRTKNVHLLANMPPLELKKWYKKVKYLLCTSLYYETFGLTVIEAMSYGTPVLGYAVGTRLDWIQEGHNGFFLNKPLDELYHYPYWVALSKNAYQYAKKFDSEQVMAQHLELYKRIV